MNARRSIRYRPHCPFPVEKRNPLRSGRGRKLEGKLFGMSSGAISHFGLLWVGNNCDVMEINGHRIAPLGFAFLISTLLLVSFLHPIGNN
jgi:hypothetical protein